MTFSVICAKQIKIFIHSYYRTCRLRYFIIMPRPLGGGIKRWCCVTSVWRLTSVCLTSVWRLSHTLGLSREQRGLGILKLTQRYSPHTWLGHHFQRHKVKGGIAWWPPAPLVILGSACTGCREVEKICHEDKIERQRRRTSVWMVDGVTVIST